METSEKVVVDNMKFLKVNKLRISQCVVINLNQQHRVFLIVCEFDAELLLLQPISEHFVEQNIPATVTNYNKTTTLNNSLQRCRN